MKKVSVVIFIVGLLITGFTGLNFVTKEKVADIGTLQITRNKNHSLTWSPLIGIAVMVTGAAGYFFTTKKKEKQRNMFLN
jgi:LPXTG-motif cell wall-anchored protein